MTTVHWFVGKSGRLVGFETDGHAGDAPKGENVVCAGISAVLQTAVLGLTEVCHIKVDYTPKPQSAWMQCLLPKTLSEDAAKRADIVLKTAQVGIESIRLGYPEIISVKSVEVK